GGAERAGTQLVGQVVEREEPVEPADALGRLASRPKLLHGERHAGAEVGLAPLERPLEHGADVWLFTSEQLLARLAALRVLGQIRRLGQGDEVLGVTATQRLLIVGSGQPLSR